MFPVINPVQHAQDPVKFASLVLMDLKESMVNVNPNVGQNNTANRMEGKSCHFFNFLYSLPPGNE